VIRKTKTYHGDTEARRKAREPKQNSHIEPLRERVMARDWKDKLTADSRGSEEAKANHWSTLISHYDQGTSVRQRLFMHAADFL
jgi:hypothetical protein